MSDRTFVDTNILFYAHDKADEKKHTLAKDAVRRLWRARSGVISTQVLQELYINLRRKGTPQLSSEQRAHVLEDYMAWEVVVNDKDAIRAALALEQRHLISFWDAMILQAAHRAGVDTIYSEDLNPGQSYGDVRVVNPLL